MKVNCLEYDQSLTVNQVIACANLDLIVVDEYSYIGELKDAAFHAQHFELKLMSLKTVEQLPAALLTDSHQIVVVFHQDMDVIGVVP